MEQDPDYYFTIDKSSMAEFKDRGSRFLAFAFPLTSKEEFRVRLQVLKKEHPKAVHFCFAYRLGWDGLEFRQSDDGEPSGSAGRPIMGQLESRNLVYAAVVVVRYFGGTLLGVPGLINAYKTAASLALQTTPILRKPIEQVWLLEFDYTLMNEVMRILKQYSCRVIQQDLNLFCRLTAAIPKTQSELILQKLNDLHGLSLSRKGDKF